MLLDALRSRLRLRLGAAGPEDEAEDEAAPSPTLGPVLPPCGAALASGRINVNNPLAVPTRGGAQLGPGAGHTMQILPPGHLLNLLGL